MPPSAVKPEHEKYWKKAKAQAEKQGHGGDYAYIMGIFKTMTMNKSEGIDAIGDYLEKGKAVVETGKRGGSIVGRDSKGKPIYAKEGESKFPGKIRDPDKVAKRTEQAKKGVEWAVGLMKEAEQASPEETRRAWQQAYSALRQAETQAKSYLPVKVADKVTAMKKEAFNKYQSALESEESTEKSMAGLDAIGDFLEKGKQVVERGKRGGEIVGRDSKGNPIYAKKGEEKSEGPSLDTASRLLDMAIDKQSKESVTKALNAMLTIAKQKGMKGKVLSELRDNLKSARSVAKTMQGRVNKDHIHPPKNREPWTSTHLMLARGIRDAIDNTRAKVSASGKSEATKKKQAKSSTQKSIEYRKKKLEPDIKEIKASFAEGKYSPIRIAGALTRASQLHGEIATRYGNLGDHSKAAEHRDLETTATEAIKTFRDTKDINKIADALKKIAGMEVEPPSAHKVAEEHGQTTMFGVKTEKSMTGIDSIGDYLHKAEGKPSFKDYLKGFLKKGGYQKSFIDDDDFQKSEILADAILEKANKAGPWEKGPKGGTRRRTASGKWEYKAEGKEGEAHDPHMATELELMVNNESQLYNQVQSIQKNLVNKMMSGKYDAEKAPILWKYVADNAAKLYEKQFMGAGQKIPPADRRAAARSLAEDFYDAAMAGDYDHLLNKKNQKLKEKKQKERQEFLAARKKEQEGIPKRKFEIGTKVTVDGMPGTVQHYGAFNDLTNQHEVKVRLEGGNTLTFNESSIKKETKSERSSFDAGQKITVDRASGSETGEVVGVNKENPRVFDVKLTSGPKSGSVVRVSPFAMYKTKVEKSMSGLNEMEEYLEKAGMKPVGQNPPKKLKTGNPPKEMPTSSGVEVSRKEDGGKLDGQGMTGGPTPQPKSHDKQIGKKEPCKMEVLSPDDQMVVDYINNSYMGEGMKKSSVDLSRQMSITEQDVRAMHAEDLIHQEAQLHKSQRDVVVETEVDHPYSMSAIHSGTDAQAEQLSKGDSFTNCDFNQGHPEALINRTLLCKACDSRHSAALTACPDCGHNMVVHRPVPGGRPQLQTTILEKAERVSCLPLAKPDDDVTVG